MIQKYTGFEEHIDGLILLLTQCFGLHPLVFDEIEIREVKRVGIQGYGRRFVWHPVYPASYGIWHCPSQRWNETAV